MFGGAAKKEEKEKLQKTGTYLKTPSGSDWYEDIQKLVGKTKPGSVDYGFDEIKGAGTKMASVGGAGMSQMPIISAGFDFFRFMYENVRSDVRSIVNGERRKTALVSLAGTLLVAGVGAAIGAGIAVGTGGIGTPVGLGVIFGMTAIAAPAGNWFARKFAKSRFPEEKLELAPKHFDRLKKMGIQDKTVAKKMNHYLCNRILGLEKSSPKDAQNYQNLRDTALKHGDLRAINVLARFFINELAELKKARDESVSREISAGLTNDIESVKEILEALQQAQYTPKKGFGAQFVVDKDEVDIQKALEDFKKPPVEPQRPTSPEEVPPTLQPEEPLRKTRETHHREAALQNQPANAPLFRTTKDQKTDLYIPTHETVVKANLSFDSVKGKLDSESIKYVTKHNEHNDETLKFKVAGDEATRCYAKKEQEGGVQFSVKKSNSGEVPEGTIEKLCRLAVETASPGTVFDLTDCAEELREKTRAALDKAIEGSSIKFQVIDKKVVKQPEKNI